jgi:hypothetical protein
MRSPYLRTMVQCRGGGISRKERRERKDSEKFSEDPSLSSLSSLRLIVWWTARIAGSRKWVMQSPYLKTKVNSGAEGSLTHKISSPEGTAEISFSRGVPQHFNRPPSGLQRSTVIEPGVETP